MKCELSIGYRARIVSLIASYCVVLIHTVNHPWRLDVAIMTQWAVPWFLFLSGVFFRAAISKYDILHIIIDRSKKLLCPYLIFGLFGYIVISPSNEKNISYIFGLLTHSPEYNQPLWFLKSLYIYSIICLGCFKFLNKLQHNALKCLLCAGLYFSIIVALLMITNIIPMPASPFYFLIGVCISQLFLKCDQSPNLVVTIFVTIMLIIISCVIRYIWDPSCITFSAYSGQMRVVRNITNVNMICAVWIFSGVLQAKPFVMRLVSVAPASLLIYLCHFPVLQILKRFVCLNWLYSSTLGACMISLVVTLVLMGVWCLLRHYAPWFLTFVQGGRL